MTTIKALFGLRANFPRLSIRAKLAKVRKKLLRLKHGKNDSKTSIEEPPEQVMSPITHRELGRDTGPGSTPTTESSDTGSPDRSPLLGSSATTPIPQKCLVVVGGSLRPRPVPPAAGPSSIPPANRTSTPWNNIPSNGLYIKNIDLHMADSNGRKENRRAILDTGAPMSIMARDVQEDLGYKMEPYGGLIKSFEAEPVPTLGVVKDVEWNFSDGAKTFVEDFYVVDTDEFDTLIGNNCIGAHGILKFDGGEPPAVAD